MRGVPAPHRHRARRRRHHPAARTASPFPIVFFALELIGAIANKVNPDFRVRELDYILRFSGSRAFICPAEFRGFDYVAMARQLRQRIPELSHVIVAGERGGRRVESRARHRYDRPAAPRAIACA